MYIRDLQRHLRRLYPKYNTREINDLIASIRSKKHWRVHGKRGNELYVVALSKANKPFKYGFRCKSTASKIVIVKREASRYVKKGRILVVVDRGDHLTCGTVIDWLAFRRLMHHNQEESYNLFVDRPNPPSFLDRKNFKNIIKVKEPARPE